MPTAAELQTQAAAAEIEACEAENRAAALKTEAREAARKERQEKERAENAEHYARMYEEIGQPLAGLSEAQHGIVYSWAWEQGHAYGFSEVESHYGDLAEMARQLLSAT